MRFDARDPSALEVVSRKVLSHNDLVETDGLATPHLVRAVGDRPAIDLRERCEVPGGLHLLQDRHEMRRHLEERRERGVTGGETLHELPARADAIVERDGPVRGNGHVNDAAAEIGRDCGDIARAFQRIEQRTPRRKFDGRFDSSAVAQLDDFLLSYTQPQRVALNTKFHN